jgi:hypothetical protein
MEARQYQMRVSRDLYGRFRDAADQARITPGAYLGYAIETVARVPGLLDELAEADGMPAPRIRDGQPVWTYRRAAGQAGEEPRIPRVAAPAVGDPAWGVFMRVAAAAGMPLSSALAVLVHAIGRGDLAAEVSVSVRLRTGRIARKNPDRND